MFSDISTSKDLNARFRDHLKASSTKGPGAFLPLVTICQLCES